MLAASDGHMAVVKVLLEWGADVMAKDHLGDTAITRAATAKQSAVVDLLKAAEQS